VIPSPGPVRRECDEHESRAQNVVEALTRVSRDLPGIGRDQRAPERHGGYAYRGIEQITTHVAPLLAKHGVVFIPRVQAIEIRERVVEESLWSDTILTVRYQIFGPGGPADYVEAVVVGIGRDGADKGANKALTQAYKYVLIQALCIADSRDDADGETVPCDASEYASRDAVAALTKRMRALPPEVAEPFKRCKQDQNFAWPWSQSAVDAMHRRLDGREHRGPRTLRA
jgi:ERF superfamily